MLLDTDQDITRETIQYSQEYAVAKQIRKLIGNERFKIYYTHDYGSEFDISIDYDVLGYGLLAHDINSYIESCICNMKLPDKLQVKYEYTAFDWFTPLNKESEVKRSGYIVEITDPERIVNVFWNNSMVPRYSLYIKFMILGERIISSSNLYDGSFSLCIQDRGYGSTRKIIDLLKEMLKESPTT